MQNPTGPKWCREVRAIVPSDIHIFYPLTLACFRAIDNVEVFEVATEVVCEIDAIGLVAACCSPVGGVDLQSLSFRPKLFKYLFLVNLIIHSRSFFEQYLKHSAQTVVKRDSNWQTRYVK